MARQREAKQVFVNGSTRRIKRSNVLTWLLGAGLFFLGTALNMLAYSSIEPLFAAILIGTAGWAAVAITSSGEALSSMMYRSVFAVAWIAAGVAAIYANYLGDPSQNVSDAATFYDLASNRAATMSLHELTTVTEGAGVVRVWSWFYDVFEAVGFQKARYLGILVNVLCVSLSAVVGLRIAHILYGNDSRRARRVIMIFSLCGLFWLFASIHLRDAGILLVVTVLLYFWVKYLSRPGSYNLVILVVGNVGGAILLMFLRREFVFVPVAMLLAGVVSIAVFTRHKGIRRLAAYVFCGIGIAGLVVIMTGWQEELFRAIAEGYASYRERASAASGAESLGNRFIAAAPLPLRIVGGMVYLFIFPIPVWSGFQLQSAYDLFKSLNALFFYFVTPLIFLGTWRLLRDRTRRTTANVFLLFCMLGFSASVAATSLETRHFGALLAPALMLALVPDLSRVRERNQYLLLLVLFLTTMAMIHFLWAALKFG